MTGLFGKILKGILIGGGTILSLICPPVGGAVITAGMAIGAGAVAVGALIKTNGKETTVDTTTSWINKTLSNLGLLNPAGIATTSGTASGFVISPYIWIIAAIGALFLIFRKRR